MYPSRDADVGERAEGRVVKILAYAGLVHGECAGAQQPSQHRFPSRTVQAERGTLGDQCLSAFAFVAISLMAGEIASPLVSRIAVPVLYFMANSRRTTAQPTSNSVQPGE